MKYTNEFQKSLLKSFNLKAIDNIEKAMIEKNHNLVRILLEKQLDEKIMYEKGKIRESYKALYKQRLRVYSLFMNEYTKYLDGYNNRRR